MKLTIILILSLFYSSLAISEGKLKKEMIDKFSDKIKEVEMVEGDAEITFVKHAAFYKLKKDHPQFRDFLATLELRKKDQKLLNISVIIPKMEIQDLK